MAELVIARINEQGIQARDLSETFSGEHEIVIKGQQGNAGGKCVALLNGISLAPNQVKGLNCIHLINNVVQSRMVFDFSISTDTNRFINWVNGLTQGIVLMVSHTENITNTDLNTYFKTIGSAGWEYYWNSAKGTHRSSYAAILDCPLKKIMTEQFMGSGNTTPQAYISVVFDTYADIGTTGYGDTPVWDENEFVSTTSGYMVKPFFNRTGSIRELTSLHNINVGETFEVKCELMHDSQAVTDGVFASMFVQFYTSDNKYLGAFATNTSGKQSNVWHNLSFSGVVPANAAQVELSLYRYPNTPSSTAAIGCRDVIFKLRKPTVSKPQKMGTFGQWGFITSNANESTDNISGKSVMNDFIANSYDSLDQEWIPRLNGAESFTVPQYDVSGDFEYSATISFDYPSKSQITMISGDDNMYVGINTILHPLGESHVLKYGSYSANLPTTIEYNKSYTYKIEVVNNVPTFSVDGVVLTRQGNNSVIPRSFPSLTFGSIGGNTGLDGSIHEINLIDKTNDKNTRLYNFILAGDLDPDRKVKAKSRYSGLEYQALNVVPSSSSTALYCGINSGVCPYGVSVGDTVYITIRDFGGQTPTSGIVLNKKYKCTAVKNPNSNLNLHTVYLRNEETGNLAWISSGQISNLRIDVQYVANPYIDATVNGDIDWFDVNVNTAPFKGYNYLEIPSVSNTDFGLKFNISSSGGYLMEGRTLTETSDSYGGVYISPNMILSQYGSFTISKVNGIDYVAGMTVVANTDYHITGSITGTSRVVRIGARYNQVEYFTGNIWDITFDNKKDPRYYRNIVKSRYDVISNTIRDENANNTSIERTSDLNLFNWSKHDNVTINDKKSFTCTVATTPTGISKSLSGKIRIDYDITSSSEIQFLNSPSIDGGAPLIKVIPSGRSRGSIVYDNATGLYIRVMNPSLNQKVILSKFNVYTAVNDGFMYNGSVIPYKYELFEEPVIKSNSKLRWCPIGSTSGGTNLMKLDNPWKPTATSWKARVKCKLGAFSDITNPILGHTVTNNAIMLDQNGTSDTIRIFRFDNTGTARNIISVATGKPVGSDIDINITVSNDVCTLDVDGIKSSGAWNGTGNEVISLIGGRENRGFSSIIYSVDLIDSTSLLGDSRRYDFRVFSTVQPNISILPNELNVIRYIRTELLSNGEIGFVHGDEFTIKGRLKDSRLIGNYPVAEIRTLNNVNYSAYIRFDNNVRPFNNIIVELYSLDENNIEKLFGTYVANQSVDSLGYGIPYDPNVRNWLSEIGATRKIIFKPDGQGAMLRFTKQWVIS